MTALLTKRTVGEYLISHGLADPGIEIEAEELGGGISNIVLSVTAGKLRAVVKQSLDKLLVDDDWYAKRERIVTEGEALRLAGRICPGSVPQVLEVDHELGVIVIDRAPESWVNFKEELLAGNADKRVAGKCGEILAAWHSETWDSMETRDQFDDMEAFDQLRIDPYHRTVAQRHPELAPTINHFVEVMLGRRHCLVHGDFSPKNVLAGSSEVWVVDFEVAHFGDPVFDLAFMLNHLMLKAIHNPKRSMSYRQCALEFLRTYDERLETGDSTEAGYLLGHTGCLMVARVDGKSPAEYLNEAGRARAFEVGSRMLENPPSSIDEAWDALTKVAAI